MYNIYWIISILSNLHSVKEFLKMDQGWASIHRKDLFSLKPPLIIAEQLYTLSFFQDIKTFLAKSIHHFVELVT